MIRVQWREWRGTLKTPCPGEVKSEDGHDTATAVAKVSELLGGEPPCWVYVERQDVDFSGKSTSKPKARGKAK